MTRTKIPHVCITCENYRPYHCEANGSYVGYVYAGEVNKCEHWEMSHDYKKGGKFYEWKGGEQDEIG